MRMCLGGSRCGSLQSLASISVLWCWVSSARAFLLGRPVVSWTGCANCERRVLPRDRFLKCTKTGGFPPLFARLAQCCGGLLQLGCAILASSLLPTPPPTHTNPPRHMKGFALNRSSIARQELHGVRACVPDGTDARSVQASVAESSRGTTMAAMEVTK